MRVLYSSTVNVRRSLAAVTAAGGDGDGDRRWIARRSLINADGGDLPLGDCKEEESHLSATDMHTRNEERGEGGNADTSQMGREKEGREHEPRRKGGRKTRTVIVLRVCDRLAARPRASGALVRRARPVAADGDIEDEALGQKVAHDVALRVREERRRRPPRGRVGPLVLDVLGDRMAVEEPDRDGVVLERVREHAAGLHVEEVPERVVAVLHERAPRVVAVRGLALCAEHAPERLRGLVEEAAGAAVEGDLVLLVQVDALWMSG